MVLDDIASWFAVKNIARLLEKDETIIFKLIKLKHLIFNIIFQHNRYMAFFWTYIWHTSAP